MITDCKTDNERLAVVKESMETYDAGDSIDPDWSWNVLSKRTKVYSCGALCRDGDTSVHNHDEVEFALCRRLTSEAIEVIGDNDIAIGSEAVQSPCFPFFVVASVGGPLGSSNNARSGPHCIRRHDLSTCGD